MTPDALETLRTASAAGLARLLAPPPPGDVWEPQDLAAICRHQMEMAIEGSTFSLANLLRHPAPPLALLRSVQAFAKSALAEGDGPLPAEVAAVLYYASILLARLRHAVRTSQLEAPSLLRGVTQALSLTWLDADVRSLLIEGRDLLSRD